MKIQLPKEKEHLVLDNLNMVHYVLHRQLHVPVGHPDYEDYYQEGVVGLILSAIRFDESYGYQFSTFAFPNICGCIQRYRRDNGCPVHCSRSLKDVLFKIIRYSNQGYTLAEIEELTGISSRDIKDALSISSVQSIDQKVNLKDDGSSVTVGDMIASCGNEYEDLLSEENIFSTIQEVSDSISNPTYRGIWEEYIYGLFYGEKLSQQYFASKYGMSQAQISRILRRYKNQFQKILIK